ncbi:MAG: corrinoid protein [Candidatus Helarchaeota archaeon]
MSLLDEIADAVIQGDTEAEVSQEKEIISKDLDLNDAIINGLNKGMRIVGELYEKREYFLPEIIVAADALYEALAIFKPHLISKQSHKATIVCGVVRGDIHDIGKNVVKLFLEAAGYKVIDLGRNVPSELFIQTVKELNADVLALSTLMSPTLESMEEIMDMLAKTRLKNNLKVIIGGAATDEKFATEIGAIYLEDANAAIQFLNEHYAGGKT